MVHLEHAFNNLSPPMCSQHTHEYCLIPMCFSDPTLIIKKNISPQSVLRGEGVKGGVGFGGS